MKTTITPHENEGRKYLLVGGIPVDATSFKLDFLGDIDFLIKPGYTVKASVNFQAAFEYRFLGTIHTEGNALVFSEGFDPEVLVKRSILPVEMFGEFFMDYMTGRDNAESVVVSVLSLLESKGYTMLNPYGEKEPVLPINTCKCKNIGEAENCNINCDTPYADEVQQWRTSEDKRHKFKVAVIEVNQ